MPRDFIDKIPQMPLIRDATFSCAFENSVCDGEFAITIVAKRERTEKHLTWELNVLGPPDASFKEETRDAIR